ncbi:hypothetical protein M885DRAFT_192864, partial [Pelagophyceae sp. CCMP2097]
AANFKHVIPGIEPRRVVWGPHAYHKARFLPLRFWRGGCCVTSSAPAGGSADSPEVEATLAMTSASSASATTMAARTLPRRDSPAASSPSATSARWLVERRVSSASRAWASAATTASERLARRDSASANCSRMRPSEVCAASIPSSKSSDRAADWRSLAAFDARSASVAAITSPMLATFTPKASSSAASAANAASAPSSAASLAAVATSRKWTDSARSSALKTSGSSNSEAANSSIACRADSEAE